MRFSLCAHSSLRAHNVTACSLILTFSPFSLSLSVSTPSHSHPPESQGHAGTTGAATAVGEQPIKALLNCAAAARLSIAESLTNLVWAKLSAGGLADVKASGNCASLVFVCANVSFVLSFCM
jgi:hypothetical protein